MRLIALDAIGASLVELGFAADAVPVFRDAQDLSEASRPIRVADALQLRDTPRLDEEHLKAATEALSFSELAAVASRAIAEASQEPVKQKAGASSTGSPTDRGGQIIDLMTFVHPQPLTRPRASLVADSLGACDAKELAELAGPLEALQGTHPDDFSVGLHRARSPGIERFRRLQSSLERLAQLVAKTPLDTLAEGARANARERRQAARHICSGWSPVAFVQPVRIPPPCARHADRFAARAIPKPPAGKTNRNSGGC